MMVACLFAAGSAAPAGPRAQADDALRAFTSATREYVAIHRRLEQQLDPVTLTSRPEDVYRAIEQMSVAMRTARPQARQGEFFTRDVSAVLRSRIHAALAVRGLARDDVRAAEAAEGVDGTSVPLRVNEPFPWMVSTQMFPCVLDALPALPPELQYRIVGDHLVLIDLHAGLIVDVLTNALHAPTETVR
jgi:hypothetical protein